MYRLVELGACTRALALTSRGASRRCRLLAQGARSVDIAAAQRLVREAGLSIELFDDPRTFADAELDLEGRSRVAAAGTPALSRAVADALTS